MLMILGPQNLGFSRPRGPPGFAPGAGLNVWSDEPQTLWVSVSPPPRSVPINQPSFIEWPSIIRGSLSYPQILGQKAKNTH